MSRRCARNRNAEALRAQSFRPSTSSALSASPRFKTEHGHVLTPGRTACAEEMEDDGVPFITKAEKIEGLTCELATQFHESEKLQAAIRETESYNRPCLSWQEKVATRIVRLNELEPIRSYFTFGKAA